MLVGGDQITITQHNNPPETMIILITIHDVQYHKELQSESRDGAHY